MSYCQSKIIIFIIGSTFIVMCCFCSKNSVEPGNVKQYKIAFYSERDGNLEIYSINADGTGLKNLSKSSGDDVGPIWSPDGSKIAYISNRQGNWEIYTVNPDGSHQINLTSDPANDEKPCWSPDGAKIVYSSITSCTMKISL